MSEVNENSGVLTAGNTVETLQSTDRDEAATTAAATEAANTAQEVPTVPDTPLTADELLDEENTFDVSRAEFNELRDLVLSLSHGIERYNTTAPHKIPLVSINSVLTGK
jgi:hypothetical protein